ncbi:unnamed protein product [marine sediment metagenome]|uniref:Uncharacterized protein n=1 Tax=marine sediment metagenome TaxID=412755 RepID=X0U194_9ZZZZ
MEAKDTVLTETQRIDIELRVGLPIGWSADRLINEVCQDQAEISFKAGVDEGAKGGIERCAMTYNDGKLAGIKEVVEWINESFPYRMPVDGRYIDEGDYEKQLKVWGVDKPK